MKSAGCSLADVKTEEIRNVLTGIVSSGGYTMENISQKNKAIIFMIISAFFFTLMNIFVRLSGDIPVIQKSFFRNFVALIVAVGILIKERCAPFPNKESMGPLFIRAIAGTVGILGNYYAVDHLILADATILTQLSPFFVIIFSVFVLNERVKPFQVFAIIVAFIGALFVIKPGAGLSSQLTAAMSGILGGLGGGLAYTMVRLCNKRGAKGPQIVFFFSGFSCLVVVPYLLVNYHPMSMTQLLYLLLAGACAAVGQFTVTAAYSNAPGKEVSIFDYSQLIFAAIFGFIIFGNMPDILSVAGYIIIFGASIALFIYNNRRMEA